MSRGLGKLQREILEVVESNAKGGAALPAGKVACLTTAQIHERLPARLQLRSVQRALAGLHDRELLEPLGGGRGADGRWEPYTWTTPTECDRAYGAQEG